MGMGDKPKQYVAKYDPIMCDVSHNMFAPCVMRRCPHPKVIDRYGIGGEANVSIYVCRKCKYKVKVPFCGALGCGYELEQRVQEGEASND